MRSFILFFAFLICAHCGAARADVVDCYGWTMDERDTYAQVCNLVSCHDFELIAYEENGEGRVRMYRAVDETDGFTVILYVGVNKRNTLLAQITVVSIDRFGHKQVSEPERCGITALELTS